jgi:hypothetical protein
MCCLGICLEGLRKITKNRRTVGIQADIRTEYPLYISQRPYHLSQCSRSALCLKLCPLKDNDIAQFNVSTGEGRDDINL